MMIDGEKSTQGEIREFDTGATRDTEEGKYDYEGFLSPLVIERYGQYMNENRQQADGSIRESDNWQKGIPVKEYVKSAWRHFHYWWKSYRNSLNGIIEPDTSDKTIEDALCGLLFNTMGYLHEHIKLTRGIAEAMKGSNQTSREVIPMIDPVIDPRVPRRD
tara:strand:- start:1063 stop:1545 length:483 start_codon:yes stop_codon:yes gene_type:complete